MCHLSCSRSGRGRAEIIDWQTTLREFLLHVEQCYLAWIASYVKMPLFQICVSDFNHHSFDRSGQARLAWQSRRELKQKETRCRLSKRTVPKMDQKKSWGKPECGSRAFLIIENLNNAEETKWELAYSSISIQCFNFWKIMKFEKKIESNSKKSHGGIPTL